MVVAVFISNYGISVFYFFCLIVDVGGGGGGGVLFITPNKAYGKVKH